MSCLCKLCKKLCNYVGRCSTNDRTYLHRPGAVYSDVVLLCALFISVVLQILQVSEWEPTKPVYKLTYYLIQLNSLINQVNKQ